MEDGTARSNGKGHNVAASSRDFDFFYAGLEQSTLLVQKCRLCGAMRNPPCPACPECQSLLWDAIAVSGNGIIYSFTVHHHPPLPNFPVPLPVALVELEEGIRMVGAMDGTDPVTLKIGMPVTVEFARRGDLAAFRFKSA